MIETKQQQQYLTPEFREFLENQRRQLGREIGQKRAQIATINKLLGCSLREESETSEHFDLTSRHS